MSLRPIRDVQDGFGGGLNTSSDVYAMQPNEVRTAQNARLSTRGGISKRGGTQQVSAAAIAAYVVKGGYSWRTASAVQEMAVVNGLLHTGTLAVPMTWSAQVGALSTTAVPSFATFRGPSNDGVYIADGGPLNYWDGTTLSVNIASTPSVVDQILAWGPRLFGIGSGAPETLYWSSTTSGTNGHTLGATAGGGQAIVRTYGGQRLTALAALRGSLLIFHVSAISRFTGMTTDDINISAGTQGITNDVGTIAPRSVLVVENAAYFLSDRGVFACSESSVAPIASPIEATLSALSQTDWAKVSAVHARGKNEIWFSLPDIGIYAYNYRTGGWSGPWDGAYTSATALWDTRDSGGRTVILAGLSDGHVLWCDKGSYFKDRVTSASAAGTAYTFSVQMRRMYAGDFTAQKSWRDAYVLGSFTSVDDLSVIIETSSGEYTQDFPALSGSSAAPVWNGSTWGDDVWAAAAATDDVAVRVPLGGTWPWIDLTLTDVGTVDVQISRVEAIGFPRGRR